MKEKSVSLQKRGLGLNLMSLDSILLFPPLSFHGFSETERAISILGRSGLDLIRMVGP